MFTIPSFHSGLCCWSTDIRAERVSLATETNHPPKMIITKMCAAVVFLLASARRLIYLLLAFSLRVEWMIMATIARVYESSTALSRNRIYEFLFTQWRSSIRIHGEKKFTLMAKQHATH